MSTEFIGLNPLQRTLLDAQGDKQQLLNIPLTEDQQAVKAAFIKVSSNAQLHEDFGKALAKEMNKSETCEFMDQELAHLTDTVLSVKRNFENVRKTLITFDSKDLRKKKADGSSGGDLIEKLEPRWIAFQTKFNELLASSRETARKGMTNAERFHKVILTLAENPTTRDDAITELNGFVEDVGKFEKEAVDLGSGFDNLRIEISAFKQVMKTAMEQATSNLDKAIEETQSEIEYLESKLKAWGVTSVVGWSSLGVGAVGAGAIAGGVALGLMALTPIGWIAAAGAALVAIGGLIAGVVGEIKKAQTKRDLDAARKKLVDLNKQKGELESIAIQFDVAASEIDDIADKLAVIARVWNIFASDAARLKAALENAKKGRTTSGILLDIQLAKSHYQMLENNLETYATKMALAENDGK